MRNLLSGGRVMPFPKFRTLQQRRRSKSFGGGRTQNLIADRSSNIRKLQRSPIDLMQGDERTRRAHIHPRSKRNAR